MPLGVHLSSHIRWDHNWSYCWQQCDKNQLFARVSSVRPSWWEPCPLEFNYAAPKWGQFVLGSGSLLWLYHLKETSEQFCTSSLLVALWSSMSLRATKQYQDRAMDIFSLCCVLSAPSTFWIQLDPASQILCLQKTERERGKKKKHCYVSLLLLNLF